MFAMLEERHNENIPTLKKQEIASAG